MDVRRLIICPFRADELAKSMVVQSNTAIKERLDQDLYLKLYCPSCSRHLLVKFTHSQAPKKVRHIFQAIA